MMKAHESKAYSTKCEDAHAIKTVEDRMQAEQGKREHLKRFFLQTSEWPEASWPRPRGRRIIQTAEPWLAFSPYIENDDSVHVDFDVHQFIQDGWYVLAKLEPWPSGKPLWMGARLLRQSDDGSIKVLDKATGSFIVYEPGNDIEIIGRITMNASRNTLDVLPSLA